MQAQVKSIFVCKFVLQQIFFAEGSLHPLSPSGTLREVCQGCECTSQEVPFTYFEECAQSSRYKQFTLYLGNLQKLERSITSDYCVVCFFTVNRIFLLHFFVQVY